MLRRLMLGCVIAVLVVATGTVAYSRLDPRRAAEAEVDHFATLFSLPEFTLATVDRWGTGGNSMILAQPVRYVVVLWDFYYSENQVRGIMAHEIGHILLDYNGAPNSEENANAIAVCFGSEGAQHYKRTIDHVEVSAGRCDELKGLLQRAAPKP